MGPKLNPLQDYAVCPIPEADSGKAIRERVPASGEWNWDWIKRYLTPDICKHISAMLPPQVDSTKDIVKWRFSRDGEFPTKSAYLMMHEGMEGEDSLLGKKVWNWPGPERYKTFSWQRCPKKLLPNMQRKIHHFNR